jgi:hypothetical protein
LDKKDRHMVDIPVDGLPTDRARRISPTKAWRALALLLFLGNLSFAAVSDQARDETTRCGPFTLDQSRLDGCDWLQ